MLISWVEQLADPPMDPLYIVAPPNARTYLSEQHQLFDLGLDFDRDEPGRDVLFLDNYLVEPGKSLSPGSRACVPAMLVFVSFDGLSLTLRCSCVQS